MTLPSHQREVTAHAHNLRGISSCLITAEEVAAQIVFVFYHGLNELNESEPLELLEPLNHLNSLNPSRLSLEAKQKPEKPLGEDGGRCPAAMLPLWSYKSKLLTPKPKAYHHLP